MADESGLRAELRSGWDAKKFGELVWVEHARGGSTGAPDVFVPLGTRRGYCPLELKWWEVLGDGSIAMTAQPSQKRFHLLAGRARQRTAYLAKLASGDYVMLPGWLLQREDFDELFNAHVRLRFIPGIELVRETLLDEKFWRGEG